MEGGQRKEEQKMLGKKATEVFDLLYRVKKVNNLHKETGLIRPIYDRRISENLKLFFFQRIFTHN